MHRGRLRRYGDFETVGSRGKRRNGTLEEMERLGALGGPDCVLGADTHRPVTSGKVRGDFRTSMARAVWASVHGDPGDMCVLHICQERRCVNVDHLYLGTQADNNLDIKAVYALGLEVVKARMAAGGPGIRRGEDHFWVQ